MSNADPLKPVVLFIHGFGSSSTSWRSMQKLLGEDERITSRYELTTWDYPTKWVELNVRGRIPRLQELSRALAGVIDSPQYGGRELTLVGHSQGGLVIQSYFADLIGQGQAGRLRNVRQAILFATPCTGSSTAMSLRLLLSTLFHNPQETMLRVLNPDVADIRERVREHIVGATGDGAHQWRVPIHAICGMQDKIVPEASARGVFDSVKSVPGTHLSIHQPGDAQDPRYTTLVELLLGPGGHTHRFEVDTYEKILRVEPRPKQELLTGSKEDPRLVVFDNYALSTSRVRFAASNRCRDAYTIKYDTNIHGYLVGHPSHRNEASAEAKGRAAEMGTFYQFDFTPEYGEEYSISFEVYNGYPAGKRDTHSHVGYYRSRIRRLIYELDLSAYLAAGYVVSVGPTCYLQPHDVEHGDLCRLRDEHSRLKTMSETAPGIYRWELRDIERGVVDIVWDVAKAPAAPVADVAEAVRR